MKKIIVFFCVFFIGATTYGQTCGGTPLLSESFDNGIPSGWTVLNYDNETLLPTMLDKGFTGVFRDYQHLGKKCVANGEEFTSSGHADDYLVTPLLSLGAAPLCLSWKASALIPIYFQQPYEIRISTTSPDSAGFLAHPALAYFSSEASPWTEHAIDLSAYAGQQVYIGFHDIAGHGYAFFIDDILVSSPVNFDAFAAGIEFSPVVAPGTYPVSGQIGNVGTMNIQSMRINWNVNNGPVNSMTVSSLSLLPGTYYPFTHNVQWTAGASGTCLLKVWADSINNGADQYPGNDTLRKIIFVNTVPRTVLLEGFTQASCPGCFDENLHIDSVINGYLSNGKAAYVQYHVSWPGVDPMYTYNPGDPMSRVSYYGVTSVAHAVLEGEDLNHHCAFFGLPDCLITNDVDSAQAYPSIFDVHPVQTVNGNNMDVQVTIVSHADIPFNTFRLYTMMTEDSIGYTTAPGTNGETDFYRVLRKILPDSAGTALPAMTDGQQLTFNFTYPLDPQNVATNKLKTLAFIQDDSTRKVFQAAVYPAYIIPDGVHEAGNTSTVFSAFPNPASDAINLEIDNAANGALQWKIINPLGQVLIAGQDEITGAVFTRNISLKGLSAGVYFIVVQTAGTSSVIRFVKD